MTRNYQGCVERHHEKKLKADGRSTTVKREDIIAQFKDAADDQVKAILDINSADITKALGKQGGEITTLQAKATDLEGQLTTANNTIKALEAAKGNAEDLQKQIDAYKQAEADRKAAETAAQLQATVEARFDAVVGDRKFLHDFVRKGVLDEFEAALADKANTGKGDKDLFDALTKDKGYFASQNPPINMGGAGGGDPETDKEKFDKMSLYEQMLFAQKHPEQAAEYMK
jgi:hypothetical protein